MKKIVAVLLAVAMLLAFAACAGKDKPATDDEQTTAAPVEQTDEAPALTPVAKENIKIGFIFLHDENSTYDKNFMDAAKAAQAALGLSDDQVLLRVGVDESNACYEAAAELVDLGCNIVFADSFGHESYMIQAAKEFPNVQFCHATGTKAHTEKIANYHNAFASIYEGRFLAGIAAGLKLNEMIEAGKFTAEEAKMGYVGAFPYAEVKSGYTSFYLGAKYVCPSVTMDVTFTNSWFDEALEKEAANVLIGRDCKLISQHADSMGAPTACEEAGIPDVSYNGSTASACPNTFIVSSKINWEPYFEYIINSVINGTEIAVDYCGTIETDSVQLTEINTQAAAAGTAEKIEEVKAAFAAGTLHVFDTATFTVEGKPLESYLADVDDMGDYQGETEVVFDGFFHESEFRSAPYFDIDIDGITTF